MEPTVKEVKQDPQPDPENGVAFAVYSADDKSLDLYKRDRKPEVGDTFNGKAVTQVNDVDETNVTDDYYVPFEGVRSSVEKIEVVDSGIKPVSTIRWFNDLPSVTVADVLKLDTSVDTDMRGMFASCSSLTSLDLSGWDVSKVKTMGGHYQMSDAMFQGCSSLTSLDLSGWDTSSVSEMSCMFYGCYNLTTVGGLSDWNTSKVEMTSSMFASCSSLTSLDLSGWDMSNVTNIGGMFTGCKNLATVGDLSGWDTSSVDGMYAVFADCSSLSVNCSSWNVSNVSEHTYFNKNAPGVTTPSWNS